MTGPILIAYASRYGTTREVAEAIAATLREHELNVEVLAAAAVDDLGPYGAVVLGRRHLHGPLAPRCPRLR
jgi:menaquinone-dependent protoporphyrinogen oxidase